jgi:hypothetical protein
VLLFCDPALLQLKKGKGGLGDDVPPRRDQRPPKVFLGVFWLQKIPAYAASIKIGLNGDSTV